MHQCIFFQLVESFLQTHGQVFDFAGCALFGIHGVKIGIERGARVELAADAIETCGQAGGKQQVRIAGRVGTSEFDAGVFSADRRDTDQRASVVQGPGDVAGCFKAGYKALIGVDQWIGNRCDAAHVLQDATDEIACDLGQTFWICRVMKHIDAVLEQRHIRVQARSTDFGDWFGHEGRVHAIAPGDCLDSLLESHQAISCSDCLVEAKVNFMLAGGNLMMRGFDFKAHFLQSQDNFPPDILALTERFEIEIGTGVIGLGGRVALVIGVEQEKFTLRTHIEDVAHLFGLADNFSEDLARVAGKGLAFQCLEIADQPGHFALLRSPGEDQERVQVWLQVHVGFLDPGETFDRGTIKHADTIESLVQLARADRDIFHGAENVGELKSDESDILLFDDAENVLAGVKAHCRYLLWLVQTRWPSDQAGVQIIQVWQSNKKSAPGRRESLPDERHCSFQTRVIVSADGLSCQGSSPQQLQFTRYFLAFSAN